MTIVTIWCRHKGDSIIGIGPDIPWFIPSDFKRFRNLTLGNTLVVGKTTYETFPNRTLPNRKFVVLSDKADYEVSDKQNHKLVTDINLLKDYPEDLYVSGGASVYKAFYTTEGVMPDVAVDCVYQGEMKEGLHGPIISVQPCVDVLEKKYFALPQKFELDNVITTVWLKKGDFVEQETVKKILNYLETEGK